MVDTIVNTPGRGVTDSAVGWVIAAVIALALVIGVIALFRNNPATPSAATQVTIPNTGGIAPDTTDGTSGTDTGKIDGY